MSDCMTVYEEYLRVKSELHKEIMKDIDNGGDLSNERIQELFKEYARVAADLSLTHEGLAMLVGDLVYDVTGLAVVLYNIERRISTLERKVKGEEKGGEA